MKKSIACSHIKNNISETASRQRRSEMRPMDRSEWLGVSSQSNISPDSSAYDCPADRTLLETRATALADDHVAAWIRCAYCTPLSCCLQSTCPVLLISCRQSQQQFRQKLDQLLKGWLNITYNLSAYGTLHTTYV